ncbi:MAG: hypothetical protein JNN13_14645 [Planctomycetes bacterium]|nr:hypothetical protein [Planctomycetota bacterium]
MAIAIKKKRKGTVTKATPKARGKTATTARSKPKAPAAVRKPPPPKPDPLDDVEEPDRSSPSMAEVDAEALEFIAAIDRFKKENGRPFPSWSEVLLVVRQLGYKRG